ncbi:MAG: hypothetical protein AB7E29_09715 [Xanthobacter sp.]
MTLLFARTTPAQMGGAGCVRAIARCTLAMCAFALAGFGLPGVSQAQEQPAGAESGFDFATPPSNDANRVYSVNRLTGEMSVCQFERPQGNDLGVTSCFPQGDGAGPQKPGDYGLVPTNYTGETGIFRVNRASGEMSICYVRDFLNAKGAVESRLQCTPQAR